MIEFSKEDTRWHPIHSYSKGFGYIRYSDDIRIYDSELRDFNIDPEEFPYKENSEDIVVQIINARKRIKSEPIKNYIPYAYIKGIRV